MQWDKIELTSRMQNYIREHCMDEDFSIDALYAYTGYSKRHACRIFKELLYKTPEEYVRAVQMTASAESLIKTDANILDIALDADAVVKIPEGCSLIELPYCDYLYFQSPPYENEEDYCTAIELVFQASKTYQPERFGYRYAPKLAPAFNFGADTRTGGCISLPVQKQ